MWTISTTGIKTFLAPASLAICSASGRDSVAITLPPILKEPNITVCDWIGLSKIPLHKDINTAKEIPFDLPIPFKSVA